MHRFRESIPDLRVDKAAGKIPAVFKERSMPYDEEKEKRGFFRNPFCAAGYAGIKVNNMCSFSMRHLMLKVD